MRGAGFQRQFTGTFRQTSRESSSSLAGFKSWFLAKKVLLYLPDIFMVINEGSGATALVTRVSFDEFNTLDPILFLPSLSYDFKVVPHAPHFDFPAGTCAPQILQNLGAAAAYTYSGNSTGALF